MPVGRVIPKVRQVQNVLTRQANYAQVTNVLVPQNCSPSQQCSILLNRGVKIKTLEM